jgi:beta-ribofuranosylaminobenzene 5'-phosphate synthase
MNGKQHMNKKLIIQSFPRIHITLIGMNDDGYRINGGIGFSINPPSIHSHFVLSHSIEINDKREKKLTKDEIDKLYTILGNIRKEKKLVNGIFCDIESEIFPHYGFGSSTSIYLSCIEALLYFNDISYTREEVIALSKRGGTSGIGINTYFDGGFIFDVGIKNENDLHEPSSIADRGGKKPLIIHKGEMPEWNIGVCIPCYLKNKSEQEEIDFFKQYCPVDKKDVIEILYEASYGITSAIIENDYNIFCRSINAIQLTRWKLLERSLYGKELIDLEQKIIQSGADCVGMSSLGPLLFFMGEKIDDIITILGKENPGIRCYKSKVNNQGRIIIYA